MPQSLASLHCHIIFSTKNRVPFLAPDIQPRLFAYMGGVLREKHDALISAGGMPDHVHLLVSLSRETCVAEAVRFVKANSSKWLHETFPDLRTFTWQAGYGAFAVSFSNLESVRRYLASQAEHHKKQTFQEELLAFLQRHQLAYDERYLWD